MFFYAGVLVLLFCVAVTSYNFDITIVQFSRDIAAYCDVHPFSGVISSMGILFWGFTSAICLFRSHVHGKMKILASPGSQCFMGY